jgi:hypothetical protein
MRFYWGLSILLISLMLSQSGQAIVPQKAYTFEFNIRTEQSISWEKEQKILRAIELIREVIATPEFRRRILQHRFLGQASFQYNMGLSNRQIYQKILEGAERLQPYKNNRMDLKLEFYTDLKSNVIGYTLPGTIKVWVNNKYFNTNSDAKVAANLVHEWLHKLGFHHDRFKHSHRKYSVPYAVGKIVRDLAITLP